MPSPPRKEQKVSVGIPVFNEEKYIARLLDSVTGQTFANLEIIVYDNCSTDSTWAIIEKYRNRDNRIIAHRHPENIGSMKNFLFGIEQAQNKYFIWAGGHNFWSPDMIESCVNVLENDRSIGLAAPKTVLLDSQDRLIREDSSIINTIGAKSPADRVLMMYRQMTRCSAFYGLHRLTILQKTLPWPECVGFDYHVLMMIARTSNIITVPECSLYRRIIRNVSTQENAQRQVDVFGLTGIRAKLPILASRLYAMKIFLKTPGTLPAKLQLLTYACRRLFLNRNELRILSRELFSAAAPRK